MRGGIIFPVPTPKNVKYFKTPADLRKWFAANAGKAEELWVGFYKKETGKPSITWPESIDEALCVGWIDGIRKRVDDDSYTIRFTPRRKNSIWSAVNIRRVEALTKEKRMTPDGLDAFARRQENRSGVYSYEQRTDQLPEPYATLLKKNRSAWDFFQAQPPYYRKQIGWYVVGAKKEETRLQRLQKLIAAFARGQRL